MISFYFMIEVLGPGTFKQFVFTNTSSELPIKRLPACNVVKERATGVSWRSEGTSRTLQTLGNELRADLGWSGSAWDNRSCGINREGLVQFMKDLRGPSHGKLSVNASANDCDDNCTLLERPFYECRGLDARP
jgi:hypothetical protein